MNEVEPADRSRLLRSAQDEQSSILSTRKRKFAQYFAAAAAPDALPNHEIANHHAPNANHGDSKPYNHLDVLQGTQPTDITKITSPPSLDYDAFARFVKSSLFTQRPPPTVPNGVQPPVSSIQPPVRPPPPGPSTVPTKDESRQKQTPTLAPYSPHGAPLPPAVGQSREVKKAKTTDLGPRSSPSPVVAPVALAPSQLKNAVENGVLSQKPEVSADKAGPRVSPPQVARSVAPTPEPKSHERQVPAPPPPPPQTETKTRIAPPAIQTPPTKPISPTELAPPKPQETGRTHDAASSPASTAQSATTPAVQDVSATTSPEKEEAHPTARKEANEGDRDEVMPDAPALAAPGSSSHPSSEQPTPPTLPTMAEEVLQPSKPVLQKTPIPSPPEEPSLASPPSLQTPLSSRTEQPAPTPAEPETPMPMSPVTTITKPTLPLSSSSTPLPVPEANKENVQVPPEPMDIDKASVGQKGKDKEPAAPVPPIAPPPVAAVTPAQAPKPAPPKPVSQPVQKVQPQAPAPELPQPERAVTRVSSGAMRQKSLSEILGEPARPPKAPPAPKASQGYSAAALSGPQRKSQAARRRDKERNQVSTVVFGKQPKRMDDKAPGSINHQATSPADDYYTPLFIESFVSRSSWMKPLGALLNQAHKTISSNDAMIAYEDDHACRSLRKVYVLQHKNLWSLRQRQRCPEPIRPPSHLDVMLQEMKWMRTDFREERKWKMAMARILANACAKWHAADPEDRPSLQVSARPPPLQKAPGNEVDMVDAGAIPDLAQPDVSQSLTLLGEPRDDAVDIISPSAIFALPEDQAVFALHQSPTADLLLSELPLYGSPLKVPSSDIMQPDYDPDALWRRPALPLSKYVEGGMNLVTDGQPTWQSKFMYEDESDDEETPKYDEASPPSARRRDWLPPESSDVALFNPEMKSIKDRLHASQQFRPPTEHPMPPQSFYECRVASQWTVTEDEELKNLVNEYSYNWSLISDMLTSRSAFSSGPERRSAWECFERWVQLEPLPADLAKTQYFRAWSNRIDNAQRVVMQHQQAAQQQAAANGQPPPKRRQCVPVRVDRRHNRRHINLIGAMMKVAKKREAAQQKQQAQATMNAMRKGGENQQQPQQPRPQPPLKTPRDYSLMKWERDQALAERMAQFAQRQEAQRRAALQARQQQASMANAAAVAAAAGQMPQNSPHLPGAANPLAGPRVSMPSQFSMPGQPRSAQPLQGPMGVNGLPPHLAANLVRQLPMNSMPQAQQMQGMVGTQPQRMPIANQQAEAHVIMQARRISEQQRAAVQQQHHHAPPQLGQPSPQPQMPQGQPQSQPMLNQGSNGRQGSPPNMRNGMNGINQQNFMANAQAVMASLGMGQNGVPTLAALQNAGINVPMGSPRPHSPQISAALSAQIAAVEAQYRAKNASATPEQAKQFAVEQVSRVVLAQRTMSQHAMNAAAGGVAAQGMANGVAGPAHYAAMLRQQQQQAQAAVLAQSQAAQVQAQVQAQAQAHAQAQAQAQAQARMSPQMQQGSPVIGTPQSVAAQHQRTPSASATPGK